MADIKLENRLARGQVWYWEDPVYLDKKKSLSVDKDEYTLRYSRYVLILQDPNSIRKDSVLVAPLTSTDNRKEDVEIWIDPKQFSYVRLDKIMPVCSQNLIRYVCTLSIETMNYVDGMIMKLTLPTIYDYISQEGRKEEYKYNRLRLIPTEEELEEVKKWFNANVFYDASSNLSIEAMYNRYISDNPHGSKFNLYDFITIINQLLDNSNSQRRILVLTNSKLLPPKNTKMVTNEEKNLKKEAEEKIDKEKEAKKEEGEINKRKKSDNHMIEMNWSKSEKAQYISDFQNMTHQKCSEKYHISISSVSRIYNRIIKENPEVEKIYKKNPGKQYTESDWSELEKHRFIADYESMSRRACAKLYGLSSFCAMSIYYRLIKNLNIEKTNESKNEEDATTTKIVSEKKVEHNTSSNTAPQKKVKNIRWIQSTKDKAAVLHNLRKDVLRLEYMIRSEFVISDVFGRIMSTDAFYKSKKDFYSDLSAEIRKAIVRFAGIIVMPNSNSAEDNYKASPVMSPAQAHMYNIFIWMDKKSNHIMNNINSLSELYKSITHSSFIGIPVEYGECLKDLIIKDLGINEKRVDAIVHSLDPFFVE